MQKKVLICANDLCVGGIEKSLIEMLNAIDYNNIEITLLLNSKSGKFLKYLSPKIKVAEYKLNSNKNVIIRKIINRFNYIKFICKYRNKYDVTICYASYIKLLSKIVRKICKNNYIWIHTDYIAQSGIEEAKRFFDEMQYKKFSNLVFVSQIAKNKYLKYFRAKNQNYIYCPNLLNTNDLDIKSNEKINEKKGEKFVFVNVGRHHEHSKRLTNLFNAIKLLKETYANFEVWFVGDGPEHEMYKELVNKLEIAEYVKFLGIKTNPYPYFKIADAFILTSDYEGDPVSRMEAFYFNLPIITTAVGDRNYLNETNSIIVEKNPKSISQGMKKLIKNIENYKYKNTVADRNKNILKKLNNIINSK